MVTIARKSLFLARDSPTQTLVPAPKGMNLKSHRVYIMKKDSGTSGEYMLTYLCPQQYSATTFLKIKPVNANQMSFDRLWDIRCNHLIQQRHFEHFSGCWRYWSKFFHIISLGDRQVALQVLPINSSMYTWILVPILSLGEERDIAGDLAQGCYPAWHSVLRIQTHNLLISPTL